MVCEAAFLEIPRATIRVSGAVEAMSFNAELLRQLCLV